VIIHDYEFIIKNPIKFFFELLIMSVLPTLAVIFVIYMRKNKITSENNLELGLLAGKFLVLHLVLQLSGYYRYSLV